MHRTLNFLLLTLSIIFFAGCAHQVQDDARWKNRVHYLEKKLKLNQKQIVDLKEKYQVLETILAETKSQQKVNEASVDMVSEFSAKEVQEKSLEKEKLEPRQNEHYMYAKVIESFRKKDEEVLKRVVGLFLKTFPQSVHADNSLYLLGRLYLESRKLSEALATFERLEREYPLGNKMPASQLLRSIALKQLSRKDEAEKQLLEIQKIYPGSQESFLAGTELQILQAGG